MKTTLGSCSLCGGPVTVPVVWYGLNPPTPTCDACGAVQAVHPGPVIPMRPVRVDVRTTPPDFPQGTEEVWP